jgi:hypothetical protein
VADAYQNAANAEIDLVSSAYDIERSRGSYKLAVAERELASLRERGASARTIQAAEDEVNAIKEENEDIDRRALQASIEGAAARFEIERSVLYLKQLSAALDQQAAINAAKSGELEQYQKLYDLQVKINDPNLTQEQKAAIAEQIKIQESAIGVARERVDIEKERAGTLGTIFRLETDALEKQQATTANQYRAKAEINGWAEELNPVLEKLDRAAGITTENENRFRGVKTVVRELAGTIEVAGQAPIKIYNETEKLIEINRALADGYKAANDEAMRLLGTVEALSKAPQARFAGGDAQPGQDYVVNELGQEAFLSRAGRLSLITAPRYGRWSPPSPGVVLPAHVTSHLKARGAFGGHQLMPQPVMAAAAAAVRGGGAPDFTPLQRSLDRLDATIRTHRPTVEVAMPGNAGLLHTLQSFR